MTGRWKRVASAVRAAPLPGDWADEAACKGLAPSDGSEGAHPFFRTRGAGAVPWWIVKLCLGCPVHDECRDYALRYPVQGVWAGMAEEERVQWRREQRRRVS